MVLIFLQSTEFWALALLGCQERERERGSERERERERERAILWGCGKISLPCLCLFQFCRQSVTLSAQRCTSLINYTVCPVSTVVLALSALICPSLGGGHFSVQVCHLVSPLPSPSTLTISGLFQLFVQFWPSSGPSGAGRALPPLTVQPRVESKTFGSRAFSLVPLAQGDRCMVAVVLCFGRAISLFLAHRAGQCCQSKPTLGCRKLNLLFCGVWSVAFSFGSKTENGHPNQRLWGDLSWVGGSIRKSFLRSP